MDLTESSPPKKDVEIKNIRSETQIPLLEGNPVPNGA